MKVLLIGGSRFVGPYVVDRLLEKGHDVTIFNRGRIRESCPKRATFIMGDRDRGFDIPMRFDAVIDMCAYRGEQTKKVVEQLKSDFFVNLGTAASYRKTEVFPLTEESPIGEWPLWGGYNRGKVECERVLMGSGLDFATIRPVYILGPGNYIDREHFIYSRVKKGVPLVLPGNGQALVQFVFAREVAESIALLAEKKTNGVFNCAGDQTITLKGLVDEMGKITGIVPKIEYDRGADGEKFDEREFPFANENIFCSNDKLRKLGVRFMPLLQGLRDDYENYYKDVV